MLSSTVESTIHTIMDDNTTNLHPLTDTWTLWAHLPHNTDWSIDSYIKIHTFDSFEAAIMLCEVISEKMVQNCMLFLMRDGILPTWEDTSNKSGGCFSYKIADKNVYKSWKSIFYAMVGESTTDNKEVTLNGITISPKKNFCIIKIWIKNHNRFKSRVFFCFTGL